MEYKIAIAGPSGTGKTTIAEYIAQTLGVRHITSKETRVVSDDIKDRWAKKYLYFGDCGHKRLINLQNEFPQFGMEWQEEMLYARGRVIKENTNFIMDRSPIDSLTYMLNQVSHNVYDPKYIDSFIKNVADQLRELTHVIFIPYSNPDWVEENGSRIASVPFQKLMSSSFEHVISEYLVKHVYKVEFSPEGRLTHGRIPWKPGLLVLDMWDLQKRKDLTTEFLTKYI